jgi:hypothetical protein
VTSYMQNMKVRGARNQEYWVRFGCGAVRGTDLSGLCRGDSWTCVASASSSIGKRRFRRE